MAESTDRELVLRTRRGEVEAYGQIVRRYQSSVFNVCYRRLANRQAAEDQAQEAFLRAYQRLHTFDVERPFGPWIRRVAANGCLNHLKRTRPEIYELDEERDHVPGPSTEDVVESGEEILRLRQAIGRLSPAHRAVIELRHYQELSYAEIAEALNMPMSDVKSNLYRARRGLERLLTDDE